MRAPLVRRFVEASRLVLVHSHWGADLLRSRYQVNAEVLPQLSVPAPEVTNGGKTGPVTFGIFGGLSGYKRVLEALESFLIARRAERAMRLVIAGRSDDLGIVTQVQDLLGGLDQDERSSVTLLLDPPAGQFESAMAGCDVVVCLRWPTAGETSRVIIRAFALGKPVVASDVPQWRELPEEFCWRVPIGGPAELAVLSDIMVRVADGRLSAQAAGAAARKYAEEEAKPRQDSPYAGGLLAPPGK